MYITSTKGFTLIELMVSISIFSIVMVMSMGSILSVLDANKKSDSVRVTLDDLSYTFEGMTRVIRFGTNYHCGTSGDTTTALDCASANTSLTVTSTNADGSISYTRYFKDGATLAKEVTPVSGITSKYTLTSPDVTIQNFSFWVVGSDPLDLLQPRVIISIQGFAGKGGSQSSFNLQTTISERKLDYQ